MSKLLKVGTDYNPGYGDHRTCECGHVYLSHFNPKTKKTWGCAYSYYCDCEEFKDYIKPLTIVMLENWYLQELKKNNDGRFKKDKFFVYFGEIPNMGGHCVLAGYTSGKIYSGYHMQNFRIPTEKEF